MVETVGQHTDRDPWQELTQTEAWGRQSRYAH